MGIKDLLQDVEEQKEEVNVAMDSDGILYLSCYKYQESGNIELMYVDFWKRISAIENEIWRSYKIDEVVIALTSKANFRDKLTDKWKADRKAKPESEMTEKQLKAHTIAKELRGYVAQVKALLHKRMTNSPSYEVMVDGKQEADDKVIDLAHQGWVVVAMDSDVLHQSPTAVFNYHAKHWKWEHEGNTEQEIFESIIHLTITGGHNGNFGIKGKGEVFADKFIAGLEDSADTFNEWVSLFPLPEDALMNYRLADCSQVKNNKVKLASIKSISELFDRYYGKF